MREPARSPPCSPATTKTARFEYKEKAADEANYGEDVPAAPCEHTVRAAVEETKNYKSGATEADFTVNAKPYAGGGYIAAQYTPTCETSGGGAVASARRNSGATVDFTAAPAREDRVFTGWYSDAEPTEKMSSVKMDGDRAVYAGREKAAHDCQSARFADADQNVWYHKYADHHAVLRGNEAKKAGI